MYTVHNLVVISTQLYVGQLSMSISFSLCSGSLDPSDVLKECLKMKTFTHPHVMGILGICLADQAPYIVMPFMTNGSLHSYLRKHRPELLVSEDEDIDLVC